METILARHNRLVGPPGLVGGLISDCGLASFGNYSSCHNADSDNNGLWTSLVVAAEAFRYAVTQDADALEEAVHYFNGMRVGASTVVTRGRRELTCVCVCGCGCVGVWVGGWVYACGGDVECCSF